MANHQADQNFSVTTLKCPSCGAGFRAHESVCTYCGTGFYVKNNESRPNYSQTVSGVYLPNNNLSLSGVCCYTGSYRKY